MARWQFWRRTRVIELDCTHAVGLAQLLEDQEWELMTAYLAELGPVPAWAATCTPAHVEAHLKACPPCHGEARSVMKCKEALARAHHQECLSDEARARLWRVAQGL